MRFFLDNGNALKVTKIMTRKILFLWCLAIILNATTYVFSQKSSQTVLIVGCYSDLREISEGIIGNGIVKISKLNGKYVGTFAELQNELGLVSDEMPLENIIVDESKLTIKFSIGTGRRVTGKITKTGIKMNWGKSRGEYGTTNSFLKRGGDCY